MGLNTRGVSKGSSPQYSWKFRCTRVLDRESARLSCLARDCDNPDYTQVDRTLCDDNSLHLIVMDIRRETGQQRGGLYKIGSDEGDVTKIMPCSCAMSTVTDNGQQTQALTVPFEHFLKKGGHEQRSNCF